jgi:hypothetical protein
VVRPPLLERTVKRRLLAALALSIAGPWTLGAWIKTTMQGGLHEDAARAAQLVDYITAGSIVFLLAMVVTAAIGCVVVAVMQGPRCVGDPFPQDKHHEP